MRHAAAAAAPHQRLLGQQLILESVDLRAPPDAPAAAVTATAAATAAVAAHQTRATPCTRATRRSAARRHNRRRRRRRRRATQHRIDAADDEVVGDKRLVRHAVPVARMRNVDTPTRLPAAVATDQPLRERERVVVARPSALANSARRRAPPTCTCAGECARVAPGASTADASRARNRPLEPPHQRRDDARVPPLCRVARDHPTPRARRGQQAGTGRADKVVVTNVERVKRPSKLPPTRSRGVGRAKRRRR